MLVRGLCMECRPDESVYLERLADRPERREALWQIIRRARVVWTDRVMPAGSVDFPLPFRHDAESRFAFRFAAASRRWEPFAGFEPHPVAIELLSESQLHLVKGLAKVALRTAEHQTTHLDEVLAELEARVQPGYDRNELQAFHEEHGITKENIQAEFFGQALDEIQMATSIIDAIDRAG